MNLFETLSHWYKKLTSKFIFAGKERWVTEEILDPGKEKLIKEGLFINSYTGEEKWGILVLSFTYTPYKAIVDHTERKELFGTRPISPAELAQLHSTEFREKRVNEKSLGFHTNTAK